jgi:hypothetical protein
MPRKLGVTVQHSPVSVIGPTSWIVTREALGRSATESEQLLAVSDMVYEHHR